MDWDSLTMGPFLQARGRDAAVCAALYRYGARAFGADTVVAAAAGSLVVVTGVLLGAVEALRMRDVDGFTLVLLEDGAALGEEVADDGAETVVFGMHKAGLVCPRPASGADA